MCLRAFFIFSIAFIDVTNAMSIDRLARCIMSEASNGNEVEQTIMGFACQRNSKHAATERPTAAISQLARNILNGKVSDPAQGVNHWYSPFAMPKETESSMCTSPVGKGPLNCGGGLENVCGTIQNYIPSWAVPSKQVNITGVRDCYYKFFILQSASYDSMNSLLNKRLRF